MTISLDRESFGDGQAYYCEVPAACVQMTGSITVHAFAAGEVAQFDYELTTADGPRISGSGLEVVRWWCGTDSPDCG